MKCHFPIHSKAAWQSGKYVHLHILYSCLGVRMADLREWSPQWGCPRTWAVWEPELAAALGSGGKLPVCLPVLQWRKFLGGHVPWWPSQKVMCNATDSSVFLASYLEESHSVGKIWLAGEVARNITAKYFLLPDGLLRLIWTLERTILIFLHANIWCDLFLASEKSFERQNVLHLWFLHTGENEKPLLTALLY